MVNVAARQALEPRLSAGLTAVDHDTAANRKSMPKADFNAWPKVEEVAATISFLARPATITRGAVVPAYGKV